MATPLYPTFEKRIKDAVGNLIQQHVIPWSFLMTTNGIKVKYFDGKEIPYKGVGFEGSPRQVFWSSRYIDPYLENLCITEISTAVKMANDRGVDLKLLLLEVQALLNAGIEYVYSNMAKVDRGLRGKGNPNSVPLQPVDNNIRIMKGFLDTHIQAEFAMIKPESFLEKWRKSNKFWKWAIPIIITIILGAVQLWSNNKSKSTNQEMNNSPGATQVGRDLIVYPDQLKVVEPSKNVLNDKATADIVKFKIDGAFDTFDDNFQEITRNFSKNSDLITSRAASQGTLSGGPFIQSQMDLSIDTKRLVDKEFKKLNKSIEEILINSLDITSLDNTGPEFNDEKGRLNKEEEKCKGYYRILNDRPKSWEMSSQNSTRITNGFDVTKY